MRRSRVLGAVVVVALIAGGGFGCAVPAPRDAAVHGPAPAQTSVAVASAGAEPQSGVAPLPDSTAVPQDTPSRVDPASAPLTYALRRTGGAASGPEDARLPLVIALHGRGDRPEHFLELFAGLPLAARVVALRAPNPHPEGFSWFEVRAASGDEEGLTAGISAACDQVIATIEVLTQAWPTQGKPVVTGFSQGGMLSYCVVARAPSLLTAAFPMGGWLPPKLRPAPGAGGGAVTALPPVHAFHSRDDRVVSYPPAQEAVEALAAAGYDAQMHAYDGLGHTIDAAMRDELYARIALALDSP